MPQAKNYQFGYKELATILVKEANVREGHWGLYFTFGLAGSNVGPSEDDLKPAAIVAITSVGIQQFETPNGLTVDAAKVWGEAKKQP